MGNLLAPEPDGWMDAAACIGEPAVGFFPVRGDSAEPAKETCRSCPVRSECIEFALAHNEKFGIWGGMTERERRHLRRQRAASHLTIV